MFGAFMAEHFQQAVDWISRRGVFINVLQLAATAGMLAAYYGVMDYLHYDVLSAVFTVHQLSPVGMVYTVTTIVFFLYWLECHFVPPVMHRLLSMLGNYSYPIYLVHPVFLSACTGLAAHFHLYLRAVHILAIYLIVAGLAAAYSAVVMNLPLPRWLSVCLKGK